MAARSPFQNQPRWRQALPLTAVMGLGVVVSLMGVVGPTPSASGGDDLCMSVLADHSRLRFAVKAFMHDTHVSPSASFDLSAGVPSALSDARLVPFARQETWRGPYLEPGLSHPTPASFWSLADPGVTDGLDADPGPAVWARLHRGYGEIDDATALSVDQALDDGDPGRGTVQITGTWIWFRLADLAAPPAAR